MVLQADFDGGGDGGRGITVVLFIGLRECMLRGGVRIWGVGEGTVAFL